MRALIDGDIIVYRSAFAAEHTIYHLYQTEGSPDPSLWKFVKTFKTAVDMNKAIAQLELEDYGVHRELEVEPVENALYSAKHTVESIKRATQADDVKIFLTGKGNFREEVATLAGYKENRIDMRKPEWYGKVRDYLIKFKGAEVVNGIEADDALADCQANDTVICSIDKDLLQVPGRHYNWVKNKKYMVTPEQGLKLLWKQVLTGDSTDNIPGIKGLGPKKAAQLLADATTEDEYREICVQQWAQAIEEGKVQLVDDPSGLDPEAVVREIYRLVKVGTNG